MSDVTRILQAVQQGEPRAAEELLPLVNEALEMLEQNDPDAAKVVKLRFFAGMTNEVAGRVLGVTDRTAKRYWTFGAS